MKFQQKLICLNLRFFEPHEFFRRLWTSYFLSINPYTTRQEEHFEIHLNNLYWCHSQPQTNITKTHQTLDKNIGLPVDKNAQIVHPKSAIEIWKGIFIYFVVGSPVIVVWGLMCPRLDMSWLCLSWVWFVLV